MVSRKQTIYMLTIVLWSINSKNMLPHFFSSVSPIFPFFLSSSEKSIIKTLQSQQKESRRRAERNESILRQLERIDYQASTLAAKTERLKALKVRACYMKNSQTTFVPYLWTLKILFILYLLFLPTLMVLPSPTCRSNTSDIY